MKRSYLKDGRIICLPWGFQVIEDLVPLWRLSSDLAKPSLSKTAKLRLQWLDYYRQTNNVFLTCRRFGIAKKTLYY